MACTIDFRCLDEGFGGKTYKRKREEAARALNSTDAGTDMEVDPPSKRSAVASTFNPDKPACGRVTLDGVIAGKQSNRKWKHARTQRSSARLVSIKGKSYEDRGKEKEVKRAFRERMNELKEEIRKNKEEKRKQRVEREKKKQENILRSGTKLQKITNPNTLKKISKSKDKKLLKVVPDELVNRRRGAK